VRHPKVVNSDSNILSLHSRPPEAAPSVALVVGEVLWDQFPDSTRLGGAPLNFAVHLKRFGHTPLLVSAVGTDRLGEEARAAIAGFGLDTTGLQSISGFHTGTAAVRLGPGEQTSFEIARPAAYDAIELYDRDVRQLLLRHPAWFYYGTLFPSSPRAKCVLRQLLAAAPDATRFYDMNLRPGFESPELVRELLEWADVVKLNERELQFVHDHLELPLDAEAFCRTGSKQYGWTAACVTFGSRGCAMLVGDDYVSSPGVPVQVADPVGAGDAFAAAFVHGLASGWTAAQIAAFANRVGAVVAATHGAIPDVVPIEPQP
jgi:fructokinase